MAAIAARLALTVTFSILSTPPRPLSAPTPQMPEIRTVAAILPSTGSCQPRSFMPKAVSSTR